MGGELTLRSEPGRGSTFSVRALPARGGRPRRRSAAPHRAGHRLPRPAPHAAGGGRPADAAPDAGRHAGAAGLRRARGRQRHRVPGERARARAPTPSCSTSRMDDMDGWETARRVRARRLRRRCRSSWSRPTCSRTRPSELRAAGCQGFVGKPVIESELLDDAGAPPAASNGWPSCAAAAAAPRRRRRRRAELRAARRRARASCMRLVQLGHVRGLQQRARPRWPHEHPRMRRQLHARCARWSTASTSTSFKDRIWRRTRHVAANA